MQSKYVIMVLVLLFSFMSLSVYADTPLKKLGRGFCNIVTCPLEIAKGVQETHNENGAFAALTLGLLKGVFYTGVRAVVGVYEVVTFPLPVPKDFKPILTDPEFFYEGGFLY